MTDHPVLIPFPSSDHKHHRCLAAALATAESVCRERGLRLTALRRRVLELIWGNHEPVKAYDLLDSLKTVHRSAAPPTVYRALDFLQQQGFVHRIESLNAYVGCGEPGHANASQFLICHRCGQVAELDDNDILELLLARAKRLGFVIHGQTIELRGCCSACQPD